MKASIVLPYNLRGNVILTVDFLVSYDAHDIKVQTTGHKRGPQHCIYIRTGGALALFRLLLSGLYLQELVEGPCSQDPLQPPRAALFQ